MGLGMAERGHFLVVTLFLGSIFNTPKVSKTLFYGVRTLTVDILGVHEMSTRHPKLRVGPVVGHYYTYMLSCIIMYNIIQ